MPVASTEQDDDALLWDQIANEALRIEEAVLQSRATDGTPPPHPSFPAPSVAPPPPRRPLRAPSTRATPATPSTATGRPTPPPTEPGQRRPPARPSRGTGTSAPPAILGLPERNVGISSTPEASSVSGSGPGPTFGEDSFTRLLRAKDVEIQRMRMEKDGEISNLRHRMRALSSQLESRGKPAQTGSVQSKEPADVLDKVMEERTRLAKDAAIADSELRRVSEQLAFARQEIDALKETQRKLVVNAARVAPEKQQGSEFPAPGALGANLVSNPAAGVRYTQRSATQPGSEFVENTQAGGKLVNSAKFIGYDMSRGPRPPRRRRPSSSGDRASSVGPNFTGNAAYHEVTQDVSPLRSLPQADSLAEDMVASTGIFPVALSDPLLEDDARICGSAETRRKRALSGDEEPVVQIVWGCMNSRTGENDSVNLRRALFGNGRGEKLLEICASAKKPNLRRAVAHAMENNCEWSEMLIPVAELCHVGDSISALALEVVCSLLEHSESCRQACVLNKDYRVVPDTALRILEEATNCRDCKISCLTLRILSCLISETLLLAPCNSASGGAVEEHITSMEKEYASSMRQHMEHEAVLVWLQELDKENAEACSIAAEVASELVLNVLGTSAEHGEREGDFLEQALLCFASALPGSWVDERVKTLALCSLDWASQSAAYFLQEKDARVIESICLFFIEAVHRMHVRAHVWARARDSFCELISGNIEAAPLCWRMFDDTGDTGMRLGNEAEIAAITRAVGIARRLAQRSPDDFSLATEVSGTTRNFALSTLVQLGWPESGEHFGGKSKVCGRDGFALVHSEQDTLAIDSRVLFYALACSDPDI
jgi:hypothetical protein